MYQSIMIIPPMKVGGQEKEEENENENEEQHNTRKNSTTQQQQQNKSRIEELKMISAAEDKDKDNKGSSFLPVVQQNNNDTGEFTTERCETLPVASVDTILWGGGEGDQVHDVIGAFFIAKRLGVKLIEQNLRKSFSADRKNGIWNGIELSSLLNYSNPDVHSRLHTLECDSCPASLWETDAGSTCMCRSRYQRGGVPSIYKSCNKKVVEVRRGGADGFNLTQYQSIIAKQKNSSLFLRRFDPCGLQRGAFHCPWLKDDIRAAGRQFFVSSYPGLRPFDGSNATCAHLRINDAYMGRVSDGLNISTMKAVDVLDHDNFGCCYHTDKAKKCSWDDDHTLKDLSFADYVKRIFARTAQTSAPDLFFMAPPGVSAIVKPLAADYGVNAYFLEDFIEEGVFRGTPTHADKILCASSSIFAGTKSSFSNVVKMMRGYQRWVWLHQYFNMSAVTVDVDKEFYRVEDWELP